MREMPFRPMKRWTITLSTVDETTLAEGLARYRWGSSARVTLEGLVLTVVGPDSHGAVASFKADVEGGKSKPGWR